MKDVAEAARAHTGAAIEALAGICRDAAQPAAARVSAANALLDRGWGRPTERREQLGPDGKPIDLRPTYTLVVER